MSPQMGCLMRCKVTICHTSCMHLFAFSAYFQMSTPISCLLMVMMILVVVEMVMVMMLV